MENSNLSSDGSRRAVAGGAIVAIAGMLAALALVYTNAAGVGVVADDARHQQRVESAIGLAATARGTIGQALLMASAADDPDVAAAAVIEAHLALDALEQRVADVAAQLDDPAELGVAIVAAVRESREVLASLSAGELDGATISALDGAARSFDFLISTLSSVRDLYGVRIADAAGDASGIATASRFMVAFFVPALAVAIAIAALRRRRQRERLAVDLEHAQSVNRSKDQLIANLSHELRTPLTGIYTAALALEDTGFADPGLLAELNGMIIEQSVDLTRMVEDLLISAQADAGQLRFDLRPVPVLDIVEAIVAEFRRAGAFVKTELEPGHMLADPSRLRQVLRNLVSNAVRYGGDSIRISGEVTEQTYTLRISDDGPGLSEQVASRLFERFVHRDETPSIVGSVGLGLAITRVLTQGMSGEISHTRHDGITTFLVSIPRATDPTAEPPPDPSPLRPAMLVTEEEPSTTEESSAVE